MKEYSLSDIRDKSATVIIAYTIRAMNNCGFLDEQNCDEYGLMSIANYDDKEYFDDLRKYLICHGFSTEYISKEWDDIEQTMMMAADNRILTGNYDKGYIEW